ncbi:MAG: Na+/H+ antiporter subunit B [Pseudomonadota bacterium]|nr:Na+/H+ antiporter subunit B [Pseudomonadota bacterium]
MTQDIVLRTATRFLFTLLLLFSIFLLVRGHNEPGGGFVGGLVAASAFALYSIAYDVMVARRVLWLDPRTLIGLGLLIAVSSGLLAVFLGQPFLTGRWGYINVLGVGQLDVGTPLLFDIGVYLVVVGVTLTIILALSEE